MVLCIFGAWQTDPASACFVNAKFTCSGFCAPETPVTPGKRKSEAKKEKGTPPAKKVKTDGEGET